MEWNGYWGSIWPTQTTLWLRHCYYCCGRIPCSPITTSNIYFVPYCHIKHRLMIAFHRALCCFLSSVFQLQITSRDFHQLILNGLLKNPQICQDMGQCRNCCSDVKRKKKKKASTPHAESPKFTRVKHVLCNAIQVKHATFLAFSRFSLPCLLFLTNGK